MRLTVQRQWRWVNTRIVLYCVLRFPLLLLSIRHSVFLLFALAAGLPAFSGFVTWWLADGRGKRFRLLPVPAHARRAMRYSFVSYLSQLAIQAPVFVLPVLVLLAVAPKQNAVFFIAWSITTMILLLPTSVVRVLLAEGTRGRDLVRQTRISLVVNGAIGIAAAAAVYVGAGVVATVYGQGYEQATTLLPLLVTAVIPAGVVLVALTHARVIDDEPATLVLSAIYAVTVLVPSFWLVNQSGALGAAQGWFAGNCVTAVLAAAWLFQNLRKEEEQEGDSRPMLVAMSPAS
jgi:O-antigen/teichoic acid export membrane protein